MCTHGTKASRHHPTQPTQKQALDPESWFRTAGAVQLSKASAALKLSCNAAPQCIHGSFFV